MTNLPLCIMCITWVRTGCTYMVGHLGFADTDGRKAIHAGNIKKEKSVYGVDSSLAKEKTD